jgi:hypothetical protein
LRQSGPRSLPVRRPAVHIAFACASQSMNSVYCPRYARPTRQCRGSHGHPVADGQETGAQPGRAAGHQP